jgi:hypothetical protein
LFLLIFADGNGFAYCRRCCCLIGAITRAAFGRYSSSNLKA